MRRTHHHGPLSGRRVRPVRHVVEQKAAVLTADVIADVTAAYRRYRRRHLNAQTGIDRRLRPITARKLPNSPTDVHTHAGRPAARLITAVTLTVDLLTPLSMRAERLPCFVCLPSLSLIGQAVFLSQRGQTDI